MCPYAPVRTHMGFRYWKGIDIGPEDDTSAFLLPFKQRIDTGLSYPNGLKTQFVKLLLNSFRSAPLLTGKFGMGVEITTERDRIVSLLKGFISY